MNTSTLAEFKKFSKDIAPAARAVLMARAHAELERERVDAYVKPILARYAFTDDLSSGSHRGTVITDTEHLYLSTDEGRMAEFFEECDAAHRAHGFTGPKGHCPALCAENLLMQTEREFLKLGGDFLGVDLEDTYGKDRKKALELLIGAALQAK